jgi:hypothetical protein
MASNRFDLSPGAFTSSSSKPSGSSLKKTQPRVAECQLSDYSVICGRGKAVYTHVGNLRFRILGSLFTERYSRTDRRGAKSAIVSEIMKVIRQAGGTFCTYERGAWFEVKNQRARGKVTALMRDLLHTQYRSSAKAKAKRDRHWKVVKPKPKQIQPSSQKRVEGTGDSNASSTTLSCEETGDSNASPTTTSCDETGASDDSSTTSSCWGKSKGSLGFEYWLEESDNFFDIDVF